MYGERAKIYCTKLLFFKFKPYLSPVFSVIHKHILCLVTFLCGLETEVPFYEYETHIANY